MIRKTKEAQIITIKQTRKNIIIIKLININNMDKNTVKQITEIWKQRNEDGEIENWNWRNTM